MPSSHRLAQVNNSQRLTQVSNSQRLSLKRVLEGKILDKRGKKQIKKHIFKAGMHRSIYSDIQGIKESATRQTTIEKNYLKTLMTSSSKLTQFTFILVAAALQMCTIIDVVGTQQNIALIEGNEKTQFFSSSPVSSIFMSKVSLMFCGHL